MTCAAALIKFIVKSAESALYGQTCCHIISRTRPPIGLKLAMLVEGAGAGVMNVYRRRSDEPISRKSQNTFAGSDHREKSKIFNIKDLLVSYRQKQHREGRGLEGCSFGPQNDAPWADQGAEPRGAGGGGREGAWRPRGFMAGSGGPSRCWVPYQ